MGLFATFVLEGRRDWREGHGRARWDPAGHPLPPAGLGSWRDQIPRSRGPRGAVSRAAGVELDQGD